MKTKILDGMIDCKVKEFYIDVLDDNFNISDKYASFIEDVNITKWEEIYKNIKIKYEIKGCGIHKALFIKMEF